MKRYVSSPFSTHEKSFSGLYQPPFGYFMLLEKRNNVSFLLRNARLHSSNPAPPPSALHKIVLAIVEVVVIVRNIDMILRFAWQLLPRFEHFVFDSIFEIIKRVA